MTDSHNRFLGNRALSPETLMMGYGYDPFLSERAQNRRFCPARIIGTVVVDGIERDRDQLWAEAVAGHKAGESIRLAAPLWGTAAEVQRAHALEDPWMYTIGDALGNMEGRISTGDLFKILDMPEAVTQSNMSGRLGDVMRELGWDGPQVIEFRRLTLDKTQVVKKSERGYMRGEGYKKTWVINGCSKSAHYDCAAAQQQGPVSF